MKRGRGLVAAICVATVGMLAVGVLAGGVATDARAQSDGRARMRAEDSARLDRWASDVQDIYVELNPGDFVGISPLTVRSMLDRPPVALDQRQLAGDWRCRSVQFSRQGAFGYPPFQCRIRATPAGLFFEKTSGSQRLSGLLYPDDEQHLVLLGGTTANQDPQRSYRGDGDANDVVGRLYQTGRNRLMLIYTGSRGPQLYEMTR
jgi:hypothetical protein